MLKICKLGEEVLRQKSVPIKDEEINDDLRALAEEMFETMDAANGVGLACPQIGKNIRMFVAMADDDVRRVFINPQIIATSDDSVPYEEGCLSVPQVYENIMRPSKVTVQAQDQNGKRFTIEADGLLARIIQHENDLVSIIKGAGKATVTTGARVKAGAPIGLIQDPLGTNEAQILRVELWYKGEKRPQKQGD